MLRIFYQMLAVGALITLMAGSGSAMAEERSAPDLGAIDRYVEAQMAANRIPGLALAITRGKEVLYLPVPVG
jgi:hypothetical protein